MKAPISSGHTLHVADRRRDNWLRCRRSGKHAEDQPSKAQAILALHQNKRDWFVEITHSQYAVRALDWIFQRPIFKTPDFIVSAQNPAPTARKIIRDFRDRGMLRELVPAAGRAPATFIFSELLNIAEGRQAF